MQAFEFRSVIENGRPAIPEEFKQLEHKLVRVVLLIEQADFINGTLPKQSKVMLKKTS